MKWIRTAITVVIMVVSVSVIALGINNLTQEKVREEVVTFDIEIIDASDLNDIKYSPSTLYNEMKSFLILHGTQYPEYTEYVFNNGSEAVYNNDTKNIELTDKDTSYVIIKEDGTMVDNGSAGTPISITLITSEIEYIKPPQLTGTIAIILGLVPLIVASGVLYFMLRKNNLGD